MKSLIVIPARGGSKGLPGKNIKNLAGKPLICYSIDIAKQIAEDDDICVSTDSHEIKSIVENYGLKVPFLRPAELSTDDATTNDVLRHALDYYENKGRHYDNIILLQPTSPLRIVEDVHNALKLYSSEIDMVVSVKKTDSNPYYVLFEETNDGFLVKSKTGNFTRRQDCPEVWELNGAIYIFNPEKLKSGEPFLKMVKYEMEKLNSVDIDHELDFAWAEFILEKGLVKK
jgi:N-acylneuraminate cytidylyltransferase